MDTITNKVRKAMVQAMKNGKESKTDKDNLSYLLNSLQMGAKNKRAQLTEEEEISIVRKEIKNIKETLEMSGGREDIVKACHDAINLYEAYVPALMTEEQIVVAIEQAIAQLGIEDSFSIKSKGIVMKTLMPAIKGKADNKLVVTLLDQYLKSESE